MTPTDPHALAIQAIEAGDFPAAARHAHDVILEQPGSYEGYLMFAQCLSEMDPGSPRALAWAGFALQKLARDERASEQVDANQLAKALGVGEHVEPPPEVAAELEPHRLILELYDSWDGVFDPSTLEDILGNRDDCAPLLRGVLNEWRIEQIEDVDWVVVERALAILGEMGDPHDLPGFVSFLEHDDALAASAEWAFQRIAWQHPEETMALMRAAIPDAEPIERVVFASQIDAMPPVHGKIELLSALLTGIEKFEPQPREAVLATVIGALIGIEGSRSQTAASFEAQYASYLSKETKADLRHIRKETGDQPIVNEPSEITVTQICCEEPPEADEPVRKADRPGRNEPCWCGSGKKYKKCHLAEDEAR
jgi:hypothetical protein